MSPLVPLKTFILALAVVAMIAHLSLSPAPSQSILTIITKLTLMATCIQIWFWTQQMISGRGFPESSIGDWIHDVTEKWNSWLWKNPPASKYLLVGSSAVIDLMGLGLIVTSLVGKSIEPFLALIVLFSLRQLSQSFCSLPAPRGMIWYNPGFPSLLVTYETRNDFFFSGHTSIAVLASIYAWVFLPWSIALAVTIFAVGEALTVLVLRAHYTMDVMCAIFAACFSYAVAHFICVQLSI